MNLLSTYRLATKVLPWVIFVVVAKLIAHVFNIEIIPLNAIFSALIGANVFLLGFLISGVLSDYKESEKLPGELAGVLYSILDEISFVEHKCDEGDFTANRIRYLSRLAETIHQWFYKKAKTAEVMNMIEGLTGEFLLLEKYAPANYITRLKQEQGLLRKMIIRIHTIRETSFVSSGYFIGTTTTWLLILGMVFVKIEPFVESLFFVGIVTYLLLFLIRLIKDLDNPFGFYENGSTEDVSLKPFLDLLHVLTQKQKNMHLDPSQIHPIHAETIPA